jgi:2-polyprenyl-3-methyl-5-hydroxy-6-metoxy-1,4-benzoquinol methylase
MSNKEHWENVYSTKASTEVSWYQQTPETSLQFFKELNIPKTAAIIDIGGGDSCFVDHLLKMGYTNITVLDISPTAINKAKTRLGENAKSVNWVVSDILAFKSNVQYECWHDRAAFHFLTSADEISAYLAIANKNIKADGKLIISTFSAEGPQKCSGLPIKQYDENLIDSLLKKLFSKIKCITTNHITPFKTVQNFLFCSFKKLKISNGHS